MYAIILITTKNKKESESIAKTLLEEKLIACANVVGSVKSFFWWEGAIDKAVESMLILKTKKYLVQQVISRAKELHSYDVPEVIALPIVEANEDY